MNQILIIDDDWSSRTTGYERLEKALQEAAPELGIRFEIAKTPQDVVTLTRRFRLSAAIVDAVLNTRWPSLTLPNALQYLGKDVPFALISGTWDGTNAREIQSAIEHPNWRAFLHWRDINPSGDGQIMYAVSPLLAMIYDEARLSRKLHLKPDQAIRIAHLSDLQTGGFNADELKLEAKICADHILDHWKGEPTFVAFTGDVAEHGTPSQYEKARDWISFLFERLNLGSLPSERLLYVPGNHDVNVSLSAAARVRMTRGEDGKHRLELADTEQDRQLLGYSYAPFRRFLAQVCNCPFLEDNPDDQVMAWVEARFRHFGILFYGINTAQPANAFGLPNREVEANGLSKISVEITSLSRDLDHKLMVVGLGHHSPWAAQGEDCVSNPEAFAKFFGGSARTALFLHGHTHEHRFEYRSGDGYRLVTSCATTLTKAEAARPRDSLRGFNLIELGREGHVVKSMKGASFGWLGHNIQEVSPKRKSEYIFHDDGLFLESSGGRNVR